MNFSRFFINREFEICWYFIEDVVSPKIRKKPKRPYLEQKVCYGIQKFRTRNLPAKTDPPTTLPQKEEISNSF